MNKYKDLIYALDLMNEIDNAADFSNVPPCNVPNASSSCPVKVAQDWITDMTLFVHQYSSWLPVTASAGGTYATFFIASGVFSGLGLDFYDLHAYADWGLYPGLTTVCNTTVPIILGEYGQKTHNFDDWLQFATTFIFLTTAKTHCFSAALAWKYETICDPTIPTIPPCPSRGYDWWTYLIPGPGSHFGGTFRPAYYLIH
jgi:hypothetical protein